MDVHSCSFIFHKPLKRDNSNVTRVDDTSFTMCSLALSRATQWCSSLTLSDVHTAMGAYETLGRWQQALQHFPKENATEVSFNLGISACEKGGAWQSSLQLLKAMTPVRLQLS